MSRRKSCTARIQLFFGKQGTKLKRKGGSESPKPKSGQYKSFENNTLWNSEPKYSRIAQSVGVALKPPWTLSFSYSPPSLSLSRSSFERATHNLDANIKVSYDDNSNVYIEIESDDIPTLRASINSYLRLADASYRCIAEGNL